MKKILLSIVEMGGYANYSELYRSKGVGVETANSMRKAIKILKKSDPAVIVAEFNFQSDFRDRTSSLESLMATVQSKGDTKVIVFYEKEQSMQLDRLLAVFNVYETIAFPIDEQKLSDTLDRALQEAV
jgi:DNA-binding NtrC family response regulator